MRRSYGRRMIAFLMAFIMALSVLFQSDIAVGGIAHGMYKLQRGEWLNEYRIDCPRQKEGAYG